MTIAFMPLTFLLSHAFQWPVVRATTRILFSLLIGRARAGSINAYTVAILTSPTRRGRF